MDEIVMDDSTIDPAPDQRNEDYTGAVCLLVHETDRKCHAKTQVLIDADRLSDVAPYDWVIWRRKKFCRKWYVVCLSPMPGLKGWILPLHRFLADPEEDLLVDHKNRVRSDYRGRNLRVCTPQQNSWNTTPARGNSSRFKGVQRNKSPSKHARWVAAIKPNGIRQLIGTFSREEYAAYAYNVFAARHFGEFAFLNDVSLDEGEIAHVMRVIERMEQGRKQRRELALQPPEPPRPY